MEKKCKKCGTTEKVNFEGMCKKCYEDSIVIEEKTVNSNKKSFFKDKKNIAITILSIIIVLFIATYPTKNNKTIPTSSENTILISQLEEKNTDLSTQLREANEKIKSLEENNQVLSKEKEELAIKLNSISSTEALQKTIDEKNQYILNLEAQVGSLTAEKAQIEAQNGILQQQLSDSQKSNSASTTTNKSTKTTTQSNTDTSATVYITDTGSKYHRGSCSYLRSSKHSISKNSAISQGYTACSRCNP